MAARRKSGPSPAADVAAIVAEWPVDQQALASLARDLVKTTIPTAVEVAYPGWRAIGFRDPQAGYFCGLFCPNGELQVVFERGAQLADPDGIFEPPRNLKQVRMLMLRSRADVMRPAVATMLRQAVVVGSIR